MKIIIGKSTLGLDFNTLTFNGNTVEVKILGNQLIGLDGKMNELKMFLSFANPLMVEEGNVIKFEEGVIATIDAINKEWEHFEPLLSANNDELVLDEDGSHKTIFNGGKLLGMVKYYQMDVPLLVTFHKDALHTITHFASQEKLDIIPTKMNGVTQIIKAMKIYDHDLTSIGENPNVMHYALTYGKQHQ